MPGLEKRPGAGTGVGGIRDPVSEVRAGSQTRSGKAQVESFSGQIQSVDPQAKELVVKGKGDRTMAFTWEDRTKVLRKKSSVSPSELKEGSRVSVRYKREGDKNVPTTIQISG